MVNIRNKVIQCSVLELIDIDDVCLEKKFCQTYFAPRHHQINQYETLRGFSIVLIPGIIVMTE